MGTDERTTCVKRKYHYRKLLWVGRVDQYFMLSNLVHLSSNQLFVSAVVLRWHKVFNDVNQQPESIFFMHEQQSNGRNSIETLKRKITIIYISSSYPKFSCFL